MTNSYSYTALQTAKDGNIVPARNNLAFHSMYNPLREAEQFAAQFGDASAPSTNIFFVVLGLCGGYHIRALANAFPESTIIVVENTADDIAFLQQIPCVQEITKNPHISVITTEELSLAMTTRFIPAEYDAIKIVSLRAWERQFAAESQQIKMTLKALLDSISADFSVQSHFGGIWQRNIFANLKLAESFKTQSLTFPVNKNAAVIAAGPSLDESIAELKEKRDEYYIIATDTGYRALLRQGIISDAAVCVDAQMISHAHFFDLAPGTLCVLDISANPASARKIAEKNPLLFVETGHPLSVYASQTAENQFLHLSAGSGTVTIAAAAFAITAGFTNICFFGADFAYSRGKSYTKGSYLDDLYTTRANRILPAETQFDTLLFRTELIPNGNGSYSTPILNSYKISLDKFLEVNNFLKKADNEYIRSEKNAPSKNRIEKHSSVTIQAFDYHHFSHVYEKELHAAFSGNTDKTAPVFITLLPYIAWLKRRCARAEHFTEIARLAYMKTLEYSTHEN
ncbi:MAG: motility associated factor glycosyltransferase family protein [Treponema sp.]|nr:motility associated factor glycosyltransferase family protein [Treponema sp.]